MTRKWFEVVFNVNKTLFGFSFSLRKTVFDLKFDSKKLKKKCSSFFACGTNTVGIDRINKTFGHVQFPFLKLATDIFEIRSVDFHAKALTNTSNGANVNKSLHKQRMARESQKTQD